MRNLFSMLRGHRPPPVEEQKTAPEVTEIRSAHPNGHFYSPVVDPEELRPEADRIWPTETGEMSGMDFNDACHAYVLDRLFPEFFGDFDYAEHGPEDDQLTQFYVQNPQFSRLDARLLFVLLRAWKPARVIEVGSGYSTLLMADVNRRFLGGSTQIVAVEPYPRSFLAGLNGQIELIEKRVQDVAVETFLQLEAGDVLFIDSSHVMKTGSDVNHLYFEILPRLKPGVRVHVHDIFLPAEYPVEWVLDDNRSWNEQYLLRALLMFSARFRVLFGSKYAYLKHRQRLSAALNVSQDRCIGGASLWFEVTEAAR